MLRLVGGVVGKTGPTYNRGKHAPRRYSRFGVRTHGRTRDCAGTSSADPNLKFEVATLKPSPAGQERTGPCGIRPQPGGQSYSADCMSLKGFLNVIYRVEARPDHRRSGVGGQLTRFEMRGKAEKPSNALMELHVMLRNSFPHRAVQAAVPLSSRKKRASDLRADGGMGADGPGAEHRMRRRTRATPGSIRRRRSFFT